jgi:outer membrane receptor for monomeric catechols
MKTTITFSVLLLLMLGSGYGQSKTAKPFKFKSGIIEYKYSGDKTGTGIQYFDDYGMRSAMYTEITQDGQLTKSWVISSGDYQYTWDPSRPSQGMKMQNPLISWIADTPEEDLESFTESTFEKMGFVKNGQENYLGKQCTVVKGDLGKVLTWNGVLMLMEFKMGEFVSKQEAISIKTNVPVDSKYFLIPKNIKFSEMPTY